MNRETALEIIAAHGGDARRWPDADRDAVLALVVADAGVAAALAEARALDAMLERWAADVTPRSFDAAAIIRDAGVRDVRPVARAGRRWFAGGALAAAVAAGLVILAPMTGDRTSGIAMQDSAVVSATADGEAAGSDAESFAYVFTPTVDEDELI